MYEVYNGHEFDEDRIFQENIALKKNIHILEVANRQLGAERDLYKQAYERWSNNWVARFIKRIVRR